MQSISEAYILASKARAKLTSEAAHQDHDMRKLVLHANLLDDLLEKIETQKIEVEKSTPARSYSAFEHTTVTFVEDEYSDDSDDSDDDSEDEEDGTRQLATQISYSDSDSEEDDDEYEYDSDDNSEDDEDEEVAWTVSLRRVPSATNFRSLPTIDELSDQELEDLESEEEDEEEYDIPEEETDIVDLKKTPSLNYTSSTEDEEEDDKETHYTTSHGADQLFVLNNYGKLPQSLDDLLLSDNVKTQTQTQSHTQRTLIPSV